MALDQNLFSFIFHHVFFPPQLPQEAEEELARLENQMIATIVDVMQDFILNLAPESQRRWDGAFEMLHSWNNLHTADGIVERSLKSHLYSLGSFGEAATLIFLTLTAPARRRHT